MATNLAHSPADLPLVAPNVPNVPNRRSES